MRRINSTAAIFTLSFTLALIATIYMGVNETRNPNPNQSLRSDASTPTGTTTLSFDKTEYIAYPGATVPVAIKLYTPTTPESKGVVVVKASLTFANNGSITLQDTDITTPITELNYLKKEVIVGTSSTTVNIQAAYMQGSINGYIGANTTPQTFAILNFHTNRIATNNNTQLTFDPANSLIQAKVGAVDILNSTLPPATMVVVIDTDAPETVINSGPTGAISTQNASFTYSATDTPTPPAGFTNPLTFSYRLDNQTWSVYTANTTTAFTTITPGNHRFEVRARDSFGNVDATPAFRDFSYNPNTTLTVRVRMGNLSTTSRHYPKTTTITIRNATYSSGPLNTTLNYTSPTGIAPYYETQIILPDNFPTGTGTYDVLVKPRSYLTKKFSGIAIQKYANNTLTRTSTLDGILVGDTTQDNTIQIDDIGQIIAEWTESDRSIANTTVDLRHLDLNEDNFISITDIGEVIANWTSSETRGDQ